MKKKCERRHFLTRVRGIREFRSHLSLSSVSSAALDMRAFASNPRAALGCRAVRQQAARPASPAKPLCASRPSKISSSSSSPTISSSSFRPRPLSPPLPPPRALGQTEPSGGGVGTSFEGVYGPWTLTETDVLEVRAYRASLCVSAAAFAACVLGSGGLAGGFDAAGSSSPPPLPAPVVDALAATSAAALGAALTLVHVYVTPLKRLLQVLWAVGCAGAVAVAAGHGVLSEDASTSEVALSASSSIAAAVASDPGSIWLVGPAAAAATGLAFKEGICFGKLEAALLFLAIPSLCLFHLFAPAVGVPEAFIVPLERLGSVMVSTFALVFAFSKLSQPEAEDIGDKSVFTFRKLKPEEQAAALERVRVRAAFGGGGSSGEDGGGGRGSRSSGSGGSSSEEDY